MSFDQFDVSLQNKKSLKKNDSKTFWMVAEKAVTFALYCDQKKSESETTWYDSTLSIHGGLSKRGWTGSYWAFRDNEDYVKAWMY